MDFSSYITFIKLFEKVDTDQDMEVVNVTVEDLFKMDGRTAIPTIIAEIKHKNRTMSRIFNRNL